MPAPLDAHRWDCRTCGQRIGTDNPIPGLLALISDAHQRKGHEVIESHTVRGPEENRDYR